MDVEGAETAVLRGAVQTLKAFHPSMVVELHHDLPQDGPHPAIASTGTVGIPNRVAERSCLPFSHLRSMDSEQHRETA